jgi:hypothetical protein
LTKDRAMQLAREEYRRIVKEGMGIFQAAEAWGIPVMRFKSDDWIETWDFNWQKLPEYLKQGGHGVLSEKYLLEEMAKQIMEMDIEEEADDTQHSDDQGNVRFLRQGALAS